MGWAERARRADEEAERLAPRRYRVRLWTKFPPEEGERAKVRYEMAAEVYERALRKRVPGAEPTVKLVSVRKQPQIMFELFVGAANPDGATHRALYHVKRALGIGVHMGGVSRRGRRALTKLNPPWGKVEAEPLDKLKTHGKRTAVDG